MAERRMISKSMISRAKFLRLPASAQALYMHLCICADDEGIVEGFAVVGMVRGKEEDLHLLSDGGFIRILDENELISYITDWEKSNYIRKDRMRRSEYHDLLESYLANKKHVADNVPSICGQSADINDNLDGQNPNLGGQNAEKCPHRLGKDRLGKDNIAAAARAREGDKPQDVDEDLGACLRLFEDNIHPITGEIERDKLLALYDKYHREWLAEAIKEAATSNGRSIKYIERILERWERDGFKKRGSGHGGTAENAGKGKRKLTPEEERAKWDSETPGWD